MRRDKPWDECNKRHTLSTQPGGRQWAASTRNRMIGKLAWDNKNFKKSRVKRRISTRRWESILVSAGIIDKPYGNSTSLVQIHRTRSNKLISCPARDHIRECEQLQFRVRRPWQPSLLRHVSDIIMSDLSLWPLSVHVKNHDDRVWHFFLKRIIRLFSHLEGHQLL